MRSLMCASAALAWGVAGCAPAEPKPDRPPVTALTAAKDPPRAGLPGTGEADIDERESDRDVVQRDFTLRPGETVELELTMAARRSARVAYASTGPVEWRVRATGADEAYRRGFGNEETLAFVSPAADDYAFEWRNPTDEVVQLRVGVNVQQGIALRGFSRDQTAAR